MALFDIEAAISLDWHSFRDGISNASKVAHGFAGKIGPLLGGAAKVAAAGIAALSGLVGKITYDATKNYSQFQQLKGGVETLFGAGGKSLTEYAASVGKSAEAVRGEYTKLANAQSAVMKNAKKAFGTAGLSANEYMEQATSFSAALIKSLDGDTEKAAAAADRAIVDMSDNANKMGTDIESLQNAYQGFAKGNFTMLDNLKLGYSGTKEGMQQLLKDASKISGVKYDISSYSDMIEAIHVIQGEMGITGTTAAEASETIEGSINAMGAAWQNWLTGLADPDADLSELSDNLMQSVVTVADNVLPVLVNVVNSMSTFLTENAPEIIQMLIDALIAAAPGIIEAAVTLVEALVNGIIENGPAIWEACKQIFAMIWDGIISIGSTIGEALAPVFAAIVAWWETVKSDAAAKMSEIWTGIVNKFSEIKAGIELVFTTIKTTIANAWTAIVLNITTVLTNIQTGITNAWTAVSTSVTTAWNTIKTTITSALNNIWIGIVSKFTLVKDKFASAITYVRDVFSVDWSSVWTGIKTTFSNLWSDVSTIGSNIVSGLWNGISSKVDWIKEKISGFCSSALDAIKNFFGIQSPSKVMRDEVGKFLVEGLAVGINKNADEAIQAAMDLSHEVYEAAQIDPIGVTATDVGNFERTAQQSSYEEERDDKILGMLQSILDALEGNPDIVPALSDILRRMPSGRDFRRKVATAVV